MSALLCAHIMKHILVTLLALLSTTFGTFGQIIIADWTFETSQPGATNQTTFTGINPEIGAGAASGVHASAATDYSSPAGNGSTHSFSVNTWAIGDYFQFQISTLGNTGVQVGWEQTRSGTGPTNWNFAYSLNGVDFTVALNSYTVNQITWSTTTVTNASSFSVDLSSVNVLDNASAVYFRVSAASAPGSAAGTARLDDFQVTTTPVPEPREYAAVAALGLLGFAAYRRWSLSRV